MAPGKYSRVDGRKSSSYCSTVVIVGFVALCLVGVWMLMSSSAVPVQNSEFTSQETTDIETSHLEVAKKESKQFEDSSGDLPDDASKGEENTESSQDEKENTAETETVVDENQEKPEEKSDDRNDEIIEDKTESNENKKKSEETYYVKTEQIIDEKTESSENHEKPEEISEDKTEVIIEEKTESNENPNTETETNQDGNTNSEAGETEEGSAGDKSESNESGKKGETEEIFPAGAQSELLNETTTQNGAWSTQAAESKNEKEAQQKSLVSKDQTNHGWKLCNVVAGPDYIPCLDNIEAINKLTSRGHFEHRERHCPEKSPTCLVPLPEGYKISVKWPKSRDTIWYYNVPHTKLAEVKGHQNWVKVTGEYLTFPGGGTQFKNGALHYIDFIQESVPAIAWGKQTRVILDVGCGVASFGGFLFERDVLAMSFAPKDEHEAQVQFALERGIPAISGVMGTTRLPYPGRVFDAVHCARCRVPWHFEGGKLLLELNRVLRPGGHFIWSATPVYQNLPEDVEIWKAMTELTKKMCWELISITNDKLNQVGVAVYKKPTTNECYEKRPENDPPLCKESDDVNAAWYVPLEACMHKVPIDETERGSKWPEQWPDRAGKTPYWLKSSQVGVYGKSAPEDFMSDYQHWKHVVSKSYLKGLGIDWSSVRNVMDMRAVYGGFAAALKDLKVWVMNIVPIDSPDTLPIIYERGLFGMYHDWCEAHSTYPRSYDLLHADHLFSTLKKRCKIEPVIVEIDRILRPEGKLIVRDDVKTIQEIERLAKSLQWEVRLTYSKNNEGILCLQKTFWRPSESENSITI